MPDETAIAEKKAEAGGFEPVTDPSEPRVTAPEDESEIARTTLFLTTGEPLKVELLREDVLKAIEKAKSGFVELGEDLHVALDHIVRF